MPLFLQLERFLRSSQLPATLPPRDATIPPRISKRIIDFQWSSARPSLADILYYRIIASRFSGTAGNARLKFYSREDAIAFDDVGGPMAIKSRYTYILMPPVLVTQHKNPPGICVYNCSHAD